jgi:hypothetical protein
MPLLHSLSVVRPPDLFPPGHRPGSRPAALRALLDAPLFRRLRGLHLDGLSAERPRSHGPELAEALRQHVAGELRTGWSESWGKL